MNPARKHTPTRILKLIGGNLIVLLLILSVADLAARVYLRGRSFALFENTDLFVADRPFVVDHPRRGFALQPGFRNETIEINESGFRGPELPPDLDVRPTIVVFGESTTFGWNVANAGTYPFLLQEYLRANGVDSACVINAGVPSYTSLQTRYYVEEVIETLAPDVVMINVMWNDIWYSSIQNWFPEMLVLRKPSAWRQFLLKHSGIYCALVLRSEEDKATSDYFNEAALQFYGENLRAMSAAARAAGAGVVFVLPPFVGRENVNPREPVLGQQFFSTPFLLKLVDRYTARIHDAAETAGARVVGHRLAPDRRPHRSQFSDPIHPTATGNGLIAEDLGRFLIDERVVPVSR